MKVKKLFLAFFLVCLFASKAYCLEWQKIHEMSEGMAVKPAEEKARLSKNSLDDLYLLGLVYLNEYEEEKALVAFSKMLKVDKDSIEARWGKAEVLRRQYDLDQSQSLLREIIENNPGFSPAYISLAYIKYNLRDYRETARLALVVIKQDKDKVDLSNRARAYLIYGGAKGMIAHFGGPIDKIIHGTQVMPNIKRAQEIRPDTAEVYFGLGVFYLLAPPIAGGNINKAKDYLEKSIQRDPKFADSYVRLAQLYKFQGDMYKYKQYLDKALELDPKSFLAKDIQSRACNFICIEEKK